MEGVEEVRPRETATGSFGELRSAEKSKSGNRKITSQVPDEKISWESVDGSLNSGSVEFQEWGPNQTIVIATMESEPEGFFEKAGDALGIPSGRVEGDLKRFPDYIEQRGREKGGWRGQIGEGENPTLGSGQALQQEQDFRSEQARGKSEERSPLRQRDCGARLRTLFETRLDSCV
jgi:hypothetical protein